MFNKQKDKYLILILLLFIVFIILFYLSSKFSKPTKQEIVKSIPTIHLEKRLSFEPEIKLEEDNIALPSEAQVLQKDINFPTREELNAIASNLGFDDTPIISKDVINGNVYVWRDDQKLLSFTEKLNLFNFNNNREAFINYTNLETDTNISEDSLEKEAFNLLTKIINTNKNPIEYIETSYLSYNDSTEGFKYTNDPKDASIIRMEYKYTKSPFPIIDTQYGDSIIFVDFFPDGSIYKAKVILLGQLELENNSVELLDINDIKNNLDQATVISIQKEYKAMQEYSQEEIGDIFINDIDLYYTYNNSQKKEKLTPTYLIKATTTTNPISPVRLLMPAIKY